MTDSKSMLFIFLKLGLTAFGGPVAHLAYFHDEFVEKRQWLTEQEFSELVALCQFLPGPASSQVGMAIGYRHSGVTGGLLAWLGFTLPSAILLMLFAYGISHYQQLLSHNSLHYLKLVALAVVAQAIWAMGNKLCKTTAQLSIMLLSCAFILWFPFAYNQILLIIIAALIGIIFFRRTALTIVAGNNHISSSPKPSQSHWFLIAFITLLFLLPLLSSTTDNSLITNIDSFYRTGALVFGGGHVVLPMLEAEMNTHQWLDQDTFLAGYAAAQAVPGPLFTFSAFLGSSFSNAFPFWLNGIICLLAIFLPSFLLIFGIQAYWHRLRTNLHIQAALISINAAVVGLLLAAFYQPIWLHSVFSGSDLAWGLIFFAALKFWRIPAWALILAVLFFNLLF